MGEAVAGVIGVAVGLGVTWLLARRSEKAEAYRAIAQTYDRVLGFKTDHPELLFLAAHWTPDRWPHQTDRDASQQGNLWARYYSLVEASLAFVNAVLSAREEGLLSSGAYERQWKPLVDLLIVEHYPIIEEMARAPYLSAYVREFLRLRSSDDWRVSHQRLVGGAVNAS